jgi:hypothetical protein
LLLDFGAEIVVRRSGASGLPFTIDAMVLTVVYQHYHCLRLDFPF